jgi:hypothetical protein
VKFFLYYAVITLKVNTIQTEPEIKVRIEQDILTHFICAPDKEMLAERFAKHVESTYAGQRIIEMRSEIIEYSILDLLKQWTSYQLLMLRHKLLPKWLRTRLFPSKTTSSTNNSSSSTTPSSELPSTPESEEVSANTSTNPSSVSAT